MRRTSVLAEPSAFWRKLNRRNEEQLRDLGIENLKRTIAQNYFTWVIGWRSDQFRHLASKMRLGDWTEVLRAFPSRDELSRWKWFHLVVFTRMLHLYAERSDRLGLLQDLDEPLFGNPYRIGFRGRIISQDLINSVFELYAMLGDDIDFTRPLRICEIGAGYGRNAFVFLKLFERCEYTIVDIPPAIDVANAYLGRVCGNHRVTFLSPDEAERLRPDSFDLCINISSLHEMTPEQVEGYFAIVDRTVNGRFYLKQWKHWHNPVDKLTVTEADYPYRRNWRRLYSRTTLAQPSFFEAVYLI